jgi:hypothetical protein
MSSRQGRIEKRRTVAAAGKSWRHLRYALRGMNRTPALRLAAGFGIVWCCGDCCRRYMIEEARERGAQGYVYIRTEPPRVWLQYGCANDDDDDAASAAVGQQVVAELGRRGFTRIDWNGSPDQAICVHVDAMK